MNRLLWETEDEIAIIVANQMKTVRKRRKISQQELSRISAVSYGTIKRFEMTGQISFKSLIKLAMVLDAVDGIKAIFSDIPYLSIQEVINENR